MPATAIIPIKSFTSGKGRLSGAVDPETRAELNRALAGHVTATVAATGRTPLVVTADTEVALWARSEGFAVLEDPGEGLSEAARAGVQWAIGRSSPWLVIHSDLPWLHEYDVEAVALPVEDGDSVLAPSADGGTSAIGGWEPVVFRFGPSSFHRHLVAVADAAIIARPGLLLDVDDPGDLEAATRSPRGMWLGETLRPSA